MQFSLSLSQFSTVYARAICIPARQAIRRAITFRAPEWRTSLRYTSSRRAGTFAASIFVAPPGIHFLHAPIWKSCRNRKREKDSATSISQDEFSRWQSPVGFCREWYPIPARISRRFSEMENGFALILLRNKERRLCAQLQYIYKFMQSIKSLQIHCKAQPCSRVGCPIFIVTGRMGKSRESITSSSKNPRIILFPFSFSSIFPSQFYSSSLS